MLFNSYTFVFLFLPIVWAGFLLIGTRGHHRVAVSWLVAASLFFYGWWNPAYLGLILGSMLFNYALGTQLHSSENSSTSRKLLLLSGIAANLGLLGYYKYANFFIDNLNQILSSPIEFGQVLLPLAISFFTFQQIAYLVDAYRGYTREYNFLQYCLFVTFFPQLIAGPIVHHKQMMPQFLSEATYRYNAKKVAQGLTLLTLGLFKKVIIADKLSLYVHQVFNAADNGVALSPLEAWYGALCYTFQLYFDFSGYADMAIGIALLFGITLPFNFNSPYKSLNITDFWRRWHITLSHFLRDYVYIPLGGNRKGEFRRYQNLLLTMLLGGLWHGAGWTFVIWGGMHGLMLAVNHLWQSLINRLQIPRLPSLLSNSLSWLLTFTAVVFAWVVFRAENMDSALRVWQAMLGLNPLSDGQGYFYNELFRRSSTITNWISVLILTVLFLPNSLQIVGLAPGASRFRLKPNYVWILLISGLAITVILKMNNVSDFLYFRF
ncbi:MBOAT family O-acyltransferase [Amphritea sp. HPY]|uniref:MBOAT family O-acyltransferase n=1 Tax=Amphritea sp. HPY TaxID=3421652 RepID=UPI003D7DE73C